jgi:16S rRNA G1207 methylase RsmC
MPRKAAAKRANARAERRGGKQTAESDADAAVTHAGRHPLTEAERELQDVLAHPEELVVASAPRAEAIRSATKRLYDFGEAH